MAITDLTGTTWQLTNTNSHQQSGDVCYTIYGTITSGNYTITDATGYIDLYSSNYVWIFSTANGGSKTPMFKFYSGSWYYYTGSEQAVEPPILYIAGGSGCTNSIVINWLETNATQIFDNLECDLTTLPGWSELSSGQHTLTIKAKAKYYEDSDFSEGVTFTK